MPLHVGEALFVATFAFVVNMLCVMASRVLLQRMSAIKDQKKEDRLLDIAQFIKIDYYADIERILWSLVIANVLFFIPLNWLIVFKVFVRHQVGLILRSFFKRFDVPAKSESGVSAHDRAVEARRSMQRPDVQRTPAALQLTGGAAFQMESFQRRTVFGHDGLAWIDFVVNQPSLYDRHHGCSSRGPGLRDFALSPATSSNLDSKFAKRRGFQTRLDVSRARDGHGQTRQG